MGKGEPAQPKPNKTSKAQNNVDEIEPDQQKTIMTIARVLAIPETGHKILEILVKTRKKLSVTELVKLLKRSERSIRAHLRVLVEKRLLDREIEVTETKKLAYRYSIRPLEVLLGIVRREIVKQLDEIDNLNKRLKMKKARGIKNNS